MLLYELKQDVYSLQRIDAKTATPKTSIGKSLVLLMAENPGLNWNVILVLIAEYIESVLTQFFKAGKPNKPGLVTWFAIGKNTVVFIYNILVLIFKKK